MKVTHPKSTSPVRPKSASVQSGQIAWQLPSGEELAQFALRSGFMASCLMFGMRTTKSGHSVAAAVEPERRAKERPLR